MVSFFITLLRFVRALRRSIDDQEFRALLILVVALLVSGSVFYARTEGWGVIDSIYFSVITLTTIGYGDMHPTTPVSKVFTVFYILVGVGIFFAFVQTLAANAMKGGRRWARRGETEDAGHAAGESGGPARR